MPKYVAGEKRSAFEPVEVEIAGETFALKRVTGKTLRAFGRMSKQVQSGDPGAVCALLEEVLGIPPDILDELDATEIFAVSNNLMEEVQKQMEGKAGNPTGPTAKAT
jgi:hypothetical protein